MLDELIWGYIISVKHRFLAWIVLVPCQWQTDRQTEIRK